MWFWGTTFSWFSYNPYSSWPGAGTWCVTREFCDKMKRPRQKHLIFVLADVTPKNDCINNTKLFEFMIFPKFGMMDKYYLISSLYSMLVFQCMTSKPFSDPKHASLECGFGELLFRDSYNPYWRGPSSASAQWWMTWSRRYRSIVLFSMKG